MGPRIKVLDGTPVSSDKSLCHSCGSASIAKGEKRDQEIIKCRQLEQVITFKVVECNDYHHKDEVSLWQMEKIAWHISPSNSGRIGYKTPDKIEDEDKHNYPGREKY